jgi:electron-transferring-flavoprotein dehydrogenase
MTDAIEREMMETGVVIVGAGPSGLSAAIALKQKSPDLEVVIVEKSADIGGHILSGAVMDPAGLDALIPDWREQGAPVGPQVTEDSFIYLTEKSAVTFPHLLLPPIMKTKGAVIISLGDLCRWLAERAEALGVDIFPGTAAADFITGENGEILGIVTGDMGVGRDGTPKCAPNTH